MMDRVYCGIRKSSTSPSHVVELTSFAHYTASHPTSLANS